MGIVITNKIFIPALEHSYGAVTYVGLKPYDASAHVNIYKETCTRCNYSHEYHGSYSAHEFVSQGVHGNKEYFYCSDCGYTKLVPVS